jgi:hypothetical protein
VSLPEDPQLFFVVGRAKSGTSWLMNLLDTHPEILCRGEGRFFGARHRMGARLSRTLQQTLRESEGLRDWAGRSIWTRGEDFEQVADACTVAILKRTMAAELAAAGKRVGGDKTPLNGPGVAAEIARLLPEAKIIHIIRDGRDVVVSSAHHRWNQVAREGAIGLSPQERELRDSYRADPEAFVAAGRSLFTPEGLTASARTWMEQTAATIATGRELGAERYAEVRYEDLLERGPEELVRLAGFLGVQCSPEQAARCVELNRFERLTEGRPAGVEDSGAFLRAGVAGDWRRVFTAADRATFKGIAGPLLVELGYESDTDW